MMTNVGLAIVAALALVAAAAAPDVSGSWDVEFTFDESSLAGGGIDCTFKQDGERLTGNCMSASVTGEVKEQRINWQMKAGQTQEMITFTGAVNEAGTSIDGKFSMGDKSGRFTASKQ
jgi:opacity protein-like surface antigen